jgi:hypothetical protein
VLDLDKLLPDERIRCPHSGFDADAGVFRATCRSIVSKCSCPKLIKIEGANPQNNERIDKIGCVDSYMHMLTIENRAALDGVQKAVESRGNEMVELAIVQIAVAQGQPAPPLSEGVRRRIAERYANQIAIEGPKE